MPSLAALAMLLLALTGCASAEVRARCPDWSLWCGCYCGPGGAWSGTGPPRPRRTTQEVIRDVEEKMYPTKVRIVDGQVLHPTTGKLVNCELMAPFESRAHQMNEPLAAFRYSWIDDTILEVGGVRAYIGGFNAGHMRQAIAMSRACRESETNRNDVAIGMTTDQVLAAWGRPKSINETITAAGKSEQWVYGTGQHLLFENGVLSAIQRAR